MTTRENWIGVRPDTNVGGFDGDPANPRSVDNPVTSADADYTATTSSELTDALNAASSGQVVYIPESAHITTYSERFIVPGGVTLASNRGENGSTGGRIEHLGSWGSSSDHVVEPTQGCTITGLEINGQHGGYNDDDYGTVIRNDNGGFTISNCEIHGAGYAGINAGTSYAADIHHCHFHNIMRHGLGYPIVTGTRSEFLTIYENYFDGYRHAIASGGGTRWEAYDNYFASDSVGSVTDIHGTKSDCGRAGHTVELHHNEAHTGDRFHQVRGVPDNELYVHHNWSYDAAPAETVSGGNWPRVWLLQNWNCEAPTWNNVRFHDNHVDTTTAPDQTADWLDDGGGGDDGDSGDDTTDGTTGTDYGITALPDVDAPTIDSSGENELTVEVGDVTNHGDYRIQIRHSGEATWDSGAAGFQEQVVPSDDDRSGAVAAVFDSVDTGVSYEARARSETYHVDGSWTLPTGYTSDRARPTNLFVGLASYGRIGVHWDHNVEEENEPDAYELEAVWEEGASSGFEVIRTLDGGARPFVDYRDVPEDARGVTFRVSAVWADERSTSTRVSETIYDTRAVLNWREASIDANYYHIYQSRDGGDTYEHIDTIPADSTRYVTDDLVPNPAGRTYYVYNVQADTEDTP